MHQAIELTSVPRMTETYPGNAKTCGILHVNTQRPSSFKEACNLQNRLPKIPKGSGTGRYSSGILTAWVRLPPPGRKLKMQRGRHQTVVRHNDLHSRRACPRGACGVDSISESASAPAIKPIRSPGLQLPTEPGCNLLSSRTLK